jgi:hypothetical protein
MAATLQVWSATFPQVFDAVPMNIQEAVLSTVDDMGRRLVAHPHNRLQGPFMSVDQRRLAVQKVSSSLPPACSTG